jgi:hypothetical protein
MGRSSIESSFPCDSGVPRFETPSWSWTRFPNEPKGSNQRPSCRGSSPHGGGTQPARGRTNSIAERIMPRGQDRPAS